MSLNVAKGTNWRRSIVVKIFLVCFVCIHIPLIALLLNFGTGASSNPLSVGLVVLVATLIGTVACLATMWWLTLPLRNLAKAISQYRAGGTFAEEQLSKYGEDEIAVVTRAVCGMVGEISALAERVNGEPGLDPLTGLMNASAVYGVPLPRLPAQAEGGIDIYVAVFELETIEAVSARHGREVADMVLVAVGDLVRLHFAPRQIAARMSGTTFMLLFADDPIAVIHSCCDAIRKNVEQLEVGPLAAGSLRLTFGLAPRRTDEAMADLLHRADMALFRAKDTLRTGLETLKP
ncbi:two component response regulator [Agrobacterium albertimagni AOL15]|uniref:diguanylate cyclase n=1 Tax=Agrobacterium albertimagni AOL15 TaxID=1156935 RepID=K2QF20_9HYPH|nr:GGDEF domain-containing protein [Agrobacterium albertimagni]EKF59621.1 two component response regulator [Agrobacterium albertimagni AOL15]